MIDILFSILVPAYKSAYLKECIDSVLAQTYKNFELIIVDDASPEDIKSIVEQYGDSRIKFYRNEKNCGAINVVDNWNKCLSYATGDFVICMGDDDMLYPNCLEVYNQLITTYPDKNVYHGRTEIIDEHGNTISFLETRDPVESVYEHLLYRWNGRYQFIGDFVFKTEPLKCLGGFFKLPLAWASDDISVIRQAGKGGIVNTNEYVFKYRSNSCTISTSGSPQIKFDAICKEYVWYQDFLKERNVVEEKDLICYDLVLKKLEPYFLKKKLNVIIEDVAGSYLNFFSWLFNASKYNLSPQMIVYALIMAFVDRKKNEFKRKV